MSATNRRGNRARPDGNYATPLDAVDSILPHLPVGKRIIDPCAGRGNILFAIHRYYQRLGVEPEMLAGIELSEERAKRCAQLDGVTSVIPGNALQLSWSAPDLIVMNPPYTLAEVFTRRAINAVKDQNGTVAVLLRIGFAAGDCRRGFWSTHKADMAILAKRPSFEKIRNSSTDASEYAWFIFGPTATGWWFRLNPPTALASDKLKTKKVDLVQPRSTLIKL